MDSVKQQVKSQTSLGTAKTFEIRSQCFEGRPSNLKLSR